MSEHPELREEVELACASARNVPFVNHLDRRIADALLAGPVGKLQAELSIVADFFDRNEISSWTEAQTRMGYLSTLRARLADPERIRREAIGAWVQAHQPPASSYFAVDYRSSALAAGESAVTGEAT